MMIRIRDAESAQLIGELRQKIAELEVSVRKDFIAFFPKTKFQLFFYFQNQEMITRDQILDGKDLQEKLVELQDEVKKLFSSNIAPTDIRVEQNRNRS